MSEENSPFRENGNEPLGRSSTIHLPMADSPDAPEGKLSARPSEKLLEINDDLACGDASAEILTNSISLDDDESNKSTEEAKVPAFEAPKMLPFLKYSFSEDFPYSNGPDDVEYKKFRQKFIFPTSATNGTEKWIEDKELQYMLHVELQNLAKQDKKGYIFHVNAWASLREENKIENHMKRPFSRFGEPVKKIIWLANRGKKAHATRRQMQQEKLDLFKYDVLFMPVNQDSHWSLIVVNKPREIFEKLLSGDFEEEEEQRNAEEETREQDSISELVLPGMDDTTENDQLPSSEDESEKEHLDQEQNMSVSNSKEGQLDSSSDEEMNVEEARGERDDSADPSESAEKKHEPDALEKSQPAEETSMISQSEIQLSELSLGAAPEEQREEQDLAEEDHETMETDAPESEEEGDRALPYDRSDGEDEDDESEEEYSEDGGPTLRDLAEDREKVYQCPAEDEPAIYLLCSAYTQDWHEKCELMNEFLTSAFLDRTNESLRDLHEKLLEAGIIAEKSDKYYEIVAGGREPADYFCTKLHLQRQLSHLPSYQIPWPCQKCDNMEPCFHNQLLPFKYGMPYGPHQCNDFDCGNFAVYFIRRWFDSDRPDMSADAPTLKKWFTLRDIFDYKYECRRFLDKLVGWEDREPANEQGKAERYGYTDDYEEALTKWKALTDNEKQKRVEAPQAEEKVETKEEAEVTNDAAKEAETESELVPEQVKENGVHDEDPIIDNEKPAETADESEVQAQEKNVDDAQDTPPEVSPHHPQVETPVAKDEPEKIETPKEEPIVDDNVSVDTASSTVSTHNLRRRSSTPLYAPARARNTASPRNGSFDLDAVKVSPLVGESDQSPVRRKTPQEQSVENDKLVALKIYQNILNPRPKREAKTRADSILSPARVPRARRSMPTKAPKALPMKRKNEKEVGTSATKRRKTTSIPVSPKPKQSPKKVARRRKTVSSVPEDPVIKPIDAVKFFESRARFAFASTLFKDEDFPRTLRFARPNEAIMLTKPDKVKVKARKNSRRSSRIGTK